MYYLTEGRMATGQQEPLEGREEECQEVRQRRAQNVRGRGPEPRKGAKVKIGHSCNPKT